MDLQVIQNKICELRGQRVMLDFDLAELYEVETRALNQAVKRNLNRFPKDFMIRLSSKEWKALRSQIVMRADKHATNSSQFVINSRKHRGEKYLPLAFTEHGVTMLASILRSDKAVKVNISIVRAFVALREFALTYRELANKLVEMETKYNMQFKDVYEVLDLL